MRHKTQILLDRYLERVKTLDTTQLRKEAHEAIEYGATGVCRHLLDEIDKRNETSLSLLDKALGEGRR